MGKYDFDEEEDLNFEKEKRMHQRTLSKFKDLDVDVRSRKAEAVEKAMHELTKRKTKRDQLSKDFLEKYRGDQTPDARLIDFLRNRAGGDGGGGHNRDFEPNPTGFEELPWDSDDDL